MPNRLIPTDHITGAIRVIRGQRVLLDADLAKLYDVETRVLNQAVRRNSERFPDDFMFQLTTREFNNLRSQIATSSWSSGSVEPERTTRNTAPGPSHGGRRTLPLAFSEQGVAMLSGILRSARGRREHRDHARVRRTSASRAKLGCADGTARTETSRRRLRAARRRMTQFPPSSPRISP